MFICIALGTCLLTVIISSLGYDREFYYTPSGVDRTALWKAMRGTGIGVPTILLDLIIDLHCGTTASVRLGKHLSSPFMTTSGVRQGCVLAPALFHRAIDFIMAHVSRKI